MLNSKDVSAAVASYAVSKGYGYTARYQDGEIICSAGVGLSFDMAEGNSGIETEDSAISFNVNSATSEASFKTVDGQTIYLTLSVSLQPIRDTVSVLLLILLVVLIVCMLLSAIIAYFYAKSIVKPIQEITSATTRMQSLSGETSCSVNRGGEIGVLSRNINEMYQKLLSTIYGLEQQIQAVSKAEREKQDFLLLASHELKTPVTAVRSMVDGMPYNVGIYKDRDTYLAECQIGLENLLEETALRYFIIAKTRNAHMTLSLEDNKCTFQCRQVHRYRQIHPNKSVLQLIMISH